MAIVRVFTPARVHFGREYPATPTEYSVEVVKNKSISVYKDDKQGQPQLCTSFGVGDTAEYDSYNLKYTGEITKITDKCVSIVDYKGTVNERTKMLKLYDFCWRNHDFDAAKVAAENLETSYAI